jgi:hypothetical protein
MPELKNLKLGNFIFKLLGDCRGGGDKGLKQITNKKLDKLYELILTNVEIKK